MINKISGALHLTKDKIKTSLQMKIIIAVFLAQQLELMT